MKKLNGSLTIEAVISFTIFLSFMFMLLTIVKFSLVRITLNAAASETAKQIATSAYPMSYLIEYENSVNEGADQYEEKMSLTESISNEDLSNSVSELFGINSEEVSNAVSTMTKVKDLFFGENSAEAGVSLVRDVFADLEGQACIAVAGNIINDYIDNSVIPFNKDDTNLSIVKFPQSEFAYEKTGHGQGYADMELDHDSYSAEDVVIGIEYKYNFAMPFLPSFEIKMRSLRSSMRGFTEAAELLQIERISLILKTLKVLYLEATPYIWEASF